LDSGISGIKDNIQDKGQKDEKSNSVLEIEESYIPERYRDKDIENGPHGRKEPRWWCPRWSSIVVVLFVVFHKESIPLNDEGTPPSSTAGACHP
jgi:hypothetical protein